MGFNKPPGFGAGSTVVDWNFCENLVLSSFCFLWNSSVFCWRRNPQIHDTGCTSQNLVTTITMCIFRESQSLFDLWFSTLLEIFPSGQCDCNAMPACNLDLWWKPHTVTSLWAKYITQAIKGTVHLQLNDCENWPKVVKCLVTCLYLGWKTD